MAIAKTPAKRRTQIRRAALPYLYLLPAFLVMGVITFYPLVYQFIISFTNFDTTHLLLGLKSPDLKIIGFKNYVDIFTASLPVENFNFFRVLIFNFWWAISNVALHVPTGVLIAAMLNTEGLWMKRIYRAVYILPVVVPPLVVATVWRNIFDEQYGAMNQLLTFFASLIGQTDPVTIRWMNEYPPPIPGFLPGAPLTLAYYAMMIANFWLGWPFMSVVATGALQSIPRDLYEAASIDGATGGQQFWNITVPLLRPAMIPAAVYGFTLSFNLFNFVFFMTGGGPARSTELLVTFAYNLVRNLRWYGVAAAFAVIIFFVALIVFLITNRITRATQNYLEA
ncbi:MAG: sugar ABC transporter permease [Anaerolineaceae bacterium]|jgi:arabinogalactan oligomer/maltooligosaccharide transport system permease protein|nr:MAG: sugar ABC transporter permease [Anaerolineaceae bacterium]